MTERTPALTDARVAFNKVRGDKPAAVQIKVSRGANHYEAHVPIDTPQDLARQAFETLERLADEGGVWAFSEQAGWTYVRDEARFSGPMHTFDADEGLEVRLRNDLDDPEDSDPI